MITPAEINIYPLCFDLFLLENIRTVKKNSVNAFAPFTTFCMSALMYTVLCIKYSTLYTICIPTVHCAG